jgi:hypothetical protein
MSLYRPDASGATLDVQPPSTAPRSLRSHRSRITGILSADQSARIWVSLSALALKTARYFVPEPIASVERMMLLRAAGTGLPASRPVLRRGTRHSLRRGARRSDAVARPRPGGYVRERVRLSLPALDLGKDQRQRTGLASSPISGQLAVTAASCCLQSCREVTSSSSRPHIHVVSTQLPGDSRGGGSGALAIFVQAIGRAEPERLVAVPATDRNGLADVGAAHGIFVQRR